MAVIGIIRENKTPPDRRVPFTPEQCAAIQNLFPCTRMLVQPSPHRAFTDAEYEMTGIELK
jgi:saccharopine dehydrogenase (NAD+, L-lysine forming)